MYNIPYRNLKINVLFHCWDERDETDLEAESDRRFPDIRFNENMGKLFRSDTTLPEYHRLKLESVSYGSNNIHHCQRF